MTRSLDRWRSVIRAAVLAAVVPILLAPAASPAGAHPIDPDWAPPRTVYIPETGQTIDGLFLDLWRDGGRALSFGNPITPEITESDGRIVQYYEYARFEYRPEGDANGEAVTLGRIGAELRPIVVRRSSPTGESARSFQGGGGNTEGAPAIASAWLPTEENEAPADALDWRYVSETGQGVWGVFRSLWEATGETAYLGNPLTREYDVDGVTYQVFERGQLAWEPGRDGWMVPVGELLAERYGLNTSSVEQGDIPTYSEELFVSPAAVPDVAAAPPPVTGAAKSIVVSLEQQALWAYEGDRVVLRTFVSTGKERFETPSGLYYVNNKLPVQDMAGVIGGESYNVPQVPDVMYFTDRGHAIHGTYWHDNFGAPMSHGCVNLPMDVSKQLYDWAPIGTPVLIVP